MKYLLLFLTGILIGASGYSVLSRADVTHRIGELNHWWHGVKEGYAWAQQENHKEKVLCPLDREYIDELHSWYYFTDEGTDHPIHRHPEDDNYMFYRTWILDRTVYLEDWSLSSPSDKTGRWFDLPVNSSQRIPVIVTKVQEQETESKDKKFFKIWVERRIDKP